MAWTVFIESSDVRHVIPLDDEREHDDSSIMEELPFDPSPLCKCACRPRREWIQDKKTWMIIHSSFDGREGLEWVTEILNK